MLKYSVLLLLLAELNGLIGFGGLVDGGLVTLTKALFWLFLLLFSLTLVFDNRKSFSKGNRAMDMRFAPAMRSADFRDRSNR